MDILESLVEAKWYEPILEENVCTQLEIHAALVFEAVKGDIAVKFNHCIMLVALHR